MLVRFDKVKDTTDFVRKFKYVNRTKDVIIRNIEIQDNQVKCIISMRDDNMDFINMHPNYKNIKFKILDKDLI